ncbi:MAG: DUF1207 domain-containing protein [Candidatus Longimicrobiales bacterium M2_2A_002]
MASLNATVAGLVGTQALRVGWIVGVVLLSTAVGLDGQSAPGNESYCGGAADSDSIRSGNSRFLPTARYFVPLLADVKEPGFRGGFRSVEIRSTVAPASGQDVIAAGEVALGGHFGLWRYGPGDCDGLRIDLFSGVFSQFNLDVPTSDLLNTDYLVGLMVSGRLGRWSGRLRGFHQSSHLGDELLLHNPDVERINLSVEVVDLILAGDWRLGPLVGRVYAGGGRVLSSATALPPSMVRWGGDVRAEGWRLCGGGLLPLAGMDVRLLEVHQWSPSVSAKAGIEWKPTEEGPALRLLGLYLDGFMPFGQFFTSAEQQNAGAEIQLVY